jgi:hypothetical protein
MVKYEINQGESYEHELEADHFADQSNGRDREVPDTVRTYGNRLAVIDDVSVAAAASRGSRGRVMCASRACG